MLVLLLLQHVIQYERCIHTICPLNRKRKSSWKNLWLKLRSKKRRCHVPIAHWPFGWRMCRWDQQHYMWGKEMWRSIPSTVSTSLISCLSLAELDKTEHWTQGSGGEVTRGEDSEGAVQEHEEQHRGWEEAPGPHSGETPEGGECTLLCTETIIPANDYQIFFFFVAKSWVASYSIVKLF